jgi:hypothetical protein
MLLENKSRITLLLTVPGCQQKLWNEKAGATQTDLQLDRKKGVFCWQKMGRTIYVIDKQMRGCLAKAGALQVGLVNFSVLVPLVRP